MAVNKPWFPFWVQDWLSSKRVRLLKPSYRAAYVQLLCYLWIDDDCSLQDDPQTFFELSEIGKEFNDSIDSTSVQQVFSKIRPLFISHPKKEGFITNQKLFFEWQKAKKISRSRSHAGKKSVESRGYASSKDSTLVDTHDGQLLNASSTSHSHSHIVEKEKENVKKKKSLGKTTVSKYKPMPQEQEAQFQRFWVAYPKKVGKPSAWKAWLKISPDSTLAEQIMQALLQQKQMKQWLEANGKFIPHPATWLNGERYLDALDVELPTKDYKAELAL